MFLDFALLTEQQGELIDQIEFNVKSAADYVEEANVDVYHAIESSKSIRKKQWYAFIHFYFYVSCRKFIDSCCHLIVFMQLCDSDCNHHCNSSSIFAQDYPLKKIINFEAVDLVKDLTLISLFLYVSLSTNNFRYDIQQRFHGGVNTNSPKY